jgi:hypothetical protein
MLVILTRNRYSFQYGNVSSLSYAYYMGQVVRGSMRRLVRHFAYRNRCGSIRLSPDPVIIASAIMNSPQFNGALPQIRIGFGV